jgi:hypothetical protein
MNFDNDGKSLKLASLTGRDLTFLVVVNNSFFPSFGVSSNGVFVNDLMVDDTGKGQYLRQNERRWASTKLVQTILGGALGSDEIAQILATVEIVNNPGMCTHNLIVAPDSRAWVVEHDIRNLEVKLADHSSVTLTNFPLSRHAEIQPAQAQGSGADRYGAVRECLAKAGGKIGVAEAFAVLRGARQDDDVWKTELSLVYDMASRVVWLSHDGSFKPNAEFHLDSGTLRLSSGKEIRLTKSGLALAKL